MHHCAEPVRDRFLSAAGETEVEWRYDAPRFSALGATVAGNVVSTKCSGHFEAALVPTFVEAFESYLAPRFSPGSPYHIHVDFEDLAGADRITRTVYLDSLLDWYKRFPFESYTISGARPLLRAAAHLARSLLPFPVHVVRHSADVLPLLKSRQANTGAARREDQPTGSVAEHVDGLLAFMGTLNWHEKGWSDPPSESAKGPLAPIYDALLLIKESVDEFLDAEHLERKYQRALGTLLEDLNRLRRANQVRRELVEDAFHDIRTPLTLLHLQLEDLIAKADRAEHSELMKQSETANSSILRFSRRLSELLEFTRLEARQEIHDPQPFNWPELVQDIAQGLTAIAEQHGVSLCVEQAHGLPLVCGDISLVERATENLVTNAIRHSPKGSTIYVEFEARAPGVRMQVRDFGPGVPEEDRTILFDRFYRAANRSGAKEGAGLGLAIVRRVAQLHGGTVEVHNAEEGGAVFTLALPL